MATDKYKITPLRLGTITRKKSNMVYQASDTITDFPLIAWLLEGEHAKLLVDTGGSAPDGKRWMPYTRKDTEALDAALRLAGTEPAEISAVLHTHLHWDHAGNNAVLPNAKFYAQKLEYEFVRDELERGYDNELVLASEYELIDGDTENVLPGISVILTPGHSVGSQSIIVDTPDGQVVIVGDLIPTFENFEKNIPNGGNYDLGVIQASMDKVRALGLPILPGHETGVFDR